MEVRHIAKPTPENDRAAERSTPRRPAFLLWVSIFAASAFVTLALGFYAYFETKNRVSSEYADHLSVVGKLKANQISEWRRERLADAVRYAQGPALVNPVFNYLRNPGDETAKSNVLYMLALNRKCDFYANTMLVSTNGHLLLEATPTGLSFTEPSISAVRHAIATRAPAFSPIFKCEAGHTHIDTVAPIFDASGQLAALFVLRADTSQSLYPIIRFWPTGSATAETLLLERDGDSIVFLNEPRFRRGHTPNMRLPLDRQFVETQAVLGANGLIRQTDYRNVRVLADVRTIPNSEWRLLTKVDEDELFSEIRKGARMLVLSVCLGLLLSGAWTAVCYRRRQLVLYRDMYRIERDQRAAHERFRTILYSIGDAVIVTDDQACVRQMNPVAEQLTGWMENEAFGKPIDEIFRIINGQTHQPAENPVWRVLREGRVFGLANHTMLIARDGTARPIADSGAPIRDERSSLNGVVLVFRDQSAEYAAKQSLVESEAHYRDLFQNMTEGFALHKIICDDTGRPVDYRFLRVNPAFEKMTGLKAEDTVGRRVLEVLPNIEPFWIQTYGEVALTGQTVQIEHYSAPLGRYYQVRAFRPRPLHFCVIFTDITERKCAEQERSRLEEQIQLAQRMEAVGRLAGGIAHDFNNMLAIIVSSAELALDRPALTPHLADDLQTIIKTSQRAAELVKQLLAFASKQPISPRFINLSETVCAIVPMLKRALGEDITLNCETAKHLWPVRMDPSQIDQILINLTVNARDAIKGAGHISIRTQNVGAASLAGTLPNDVSDCDYVLLTVSDDGCGMDDENMAHIFEPFFTTKPVGVGTGLGLSTIYGIVKQNNGFIRVSSEPGKGTVFNIYLPRADVSPSDAPVHTPVRLAPPSAPADAKTILLVEDEVMLLRLTAAMLRKLGYTVLVASNPDEAVEIARAHAGSIDLLLTDVVMPGMSGRALRDRLTSQRAGIRCLYMSGYTANIINHHEVTEHETFDFIQKPFSIESLQAKLTAIFSNG